MKISYNYIFKDIHIHNEEEKSKYLSNDTDIEVFLTLSQYFLSITEFLRYTIVLDI